MRMVTVNGRSFFFESKSNTDSTQQHQPITNNHNNTDSYFSDQYMNTNRHFPERFSEEKHRPTLVEEDETQLRIKDNDSKFKLDENANSQPSTPKSHQSKAMNEDVYGFLGAHNKMRSLHRNTSPLKWDQELADSSCAWAEKLVKENHGNLMHCKERGENVGENLFVAMSSEMHDQNDIAEKAVKKWYDEISTYNFSRPGYTPSSGHFTQLVWSSSNRVGVGFAQAKIGKSHTVVVCARYYPAGNINMKGYFEKNVHPPKI